MVCLLEKDIEFPHSRFTSKSLKHLSLTMQHIKKYHSTVCFLTSAWDLPALTTLELCSVTLHNDSDCIDVFSKCANLKNLTLIDFKTTGLNDLSISHPRLSVLTLKNKSSRGVGVNVVAPQLKKLTIECCYLDCYKISAPDLISLNIKSYYLSLFTEGFPSLEKADICVADPDAKKIVCLLQQLYNVHFLVLNLKIVEVYL